MNTSLRTGERESEENVKDNPKANADPEEEVVHLVVKGEREKNNNLLLRPNSPPPPQLDRFVPLSDSYQMGCSICQRSKNQLEIFKTLKFFLRISI